MPLFWNGKDVFCVRSFHKKSIPTEYCKKCAPNHIACNTWEQKYCSSYYNIVKTVLQYLSYCNINNSVQMPVQQSLQNHANKQNVRVTVSTYQSEQNVTNKLSQLGFTKWKHTLKYWNIANIHLNTSRIRTQWHFVNDTDSGLTS